LIRLFLILLFLTNILFASSTYYQSKFNEAKKQYLSAILSNNKKEEISSLKKIINYGSKLRINTLKYKKELNRLDTTYSLHKPQKTKFSLDKKYSIKSVKQTKNSIIINFTKNINRSYIKFSEYKKGGYYYDKFTIKGNFKDAKPTKLKFSTIVKTTIIQRKYNKLEIIFKNRKNPKTIYIINRKQIVIKILDIKAKSKKNAKHNKKIKEKVKLLPSSNKLKNSTRVIVIDAGHGGKDSGAIGSGKKYEKTVVLNIAKEVKYRLKRRGYKVYLTRSRDKFIKLSHRTKFANKKNATMFISIHANAARKKRAKKAHGIETYFLSPARSGRAKRVAALENKGDMNSMGWSSKNSLLTILNQSKITESNKIAIDVQKNMLYSLRKIYGKKAIRDGGVREGPFWVLVGAQMPSILIEVGYISHPKEGKRIYTKRYQKYIADGIANGVDSYFRKNSF